MQINENSLIEDLSAMVRTPSVNPFGTADPKHPAEEAMAQLLESRMRELGLEVESADVADGRRNVWGRLKGRGSGPTIMLAGHLDTVGVGGYDEPFDPVIKDGCIYGRGSCDMKAGLAAYLEVMRLLIARGEKLDGDVILAGVVDEEDLMIGSHHFGTQGPHVDYAIVAEPSNLAISTTHRGQMCMILRTFGKSTHSSVPENGINAIYHMGAVIEALQSYATSLSQREPDPLCGAPSFSIGAIKGGEGPSLVPDFCQIEIDRRTIPGETFEIVAGELHGVLAPLAQSIPDFKYELLAPSLNCPPLKTDMTSPVVTVLAKAHETVTGEAADFMTFPGSTDAPNFGCPTVICGAGDLAQCHSLDEYVSIEQVKTAVSLYLETILQLQTQTLAE